MRVLFCQPVNPDILPGHEVLTCDPHRIAENLDGVDVVVPGVAEVNRDVLRRGTFGLVHQPGVGLDSIDIEAATELGVWVAHLPSDVTGNAVSVAEHAVFLALAVSRHLHESEAALAARKLGQPVGQALYGKTACIIGLGNIGSRLAQRLNAFAMSIIGVDPRPVRIEGVSLTALYPPEKLAEAVRAADYVFVCAAGDKSNHGLIDARILSAMKQGAFLVNVARGGLVDSAALLDALRSGHVAGAGLDVFETEPVDPAEPLLQQPNVVATPHIAGVTELNLRKAHELLREHLQAYALGQRFAGLVNEPPRPRHPLRAAADNRAQPAAQTSR